MKLNVMLTPKHKEMFEEFSNAMSVKGRKKAVVSQQILFAFAAAYGFMERRYKEIPDKEKTESYARIEYIRRDPTLEALMVAIAYAHLRKHHGEQGGENVRSLTWDEIYTIAENYAASGIEIIYHDMKDKHKDVFVEDLESMLIKLGGMKDE